MSPETRAGHSVPISIHLIAILYVLQAAALVGIFFMDRSHTSLLITVLLCCIPSIALWSIYRPHRSLRRFPLYGIPLMWIIVWIGLCLNHLWIGRGIDDVSPAGSVTVALLLALSVWMLLAFLLLCAMPSARRYVFGVNNRMRGISIIIFAAIIQYLIILVITLFPSQNVIYAIFYYLTMFPLWSLIVQLLEPWLYLSVLGIYCLVYTSVLYMIISRIVGVIKHKHKNDNSSTA